MLGIALVLFCIAFAVMYTGVELLQAPRLTAAGVFVFGATFLVVAIETLRTGRVFFQRHSPRSRAETFSGTAARLWGLLFLLAGLLTMAGAAAAVVAPELARNTALAVMDTRLGQGAGLALLGVFATLYGLSRVIGGSGRQTTSPLSRARDAGYRFFGVLCVIVGGALVALGVFVATRAT